MLTSVSRGIVDLGLGVDVGAQVPGVLFGNADGIEFETQTRVVYQSRWVKLSYLCHTNSF